MARRGRRLTIGGSGVALSDDESLAQTGLRGEVRRYQPLGESEQSESAAVIARAGEEQNKNAIGQGTASFVIVQSEGGGDASSSSGSDDPGDEGDPGDPGTDADATDGGAGPGGSGGGGERAQGGVVKGSESEHVIKAQKGEYVIKEASVKKYGKGFLDMLNSGKIPMMTADAYKKGGIVTDRYKGHRLA